LIKTEYSLKHSHTRLENKGLPKSGNLKDCKITYQKETLRLIQDYVFF